MAHLQTPSGLEPMPFPQSTTEMTGLDIERAEKNLTEHLEDVDEQSKALANFHYNAEEDETKPRTGIARLYRKNPSVDFMREVAIANTYELDPDEVKKVRKAALPRLTKDLLEHNICGAI